VSGVDVTRDQILDGMVTALATVTAGVGVPVSPTRYLYSAQRYMGEYTVQESQERGTAGRTPNARVAFVSERSIRTTIGRRRDFVEATYGVYMATDVQRSRDSRKTLFSAMSGVRDLLGSRALSLGIRPLRYQSTTRVIDDDKLLVYMDSYTTRYRVDYTKDPGSDVLEDAHGSIINAKVAHTSIPTAPTLTRIGAAGATTWAYAIVGIDAAGLRTLISPTASISNGAAVLNGTDKVQVSWLAYPGIVSYELHRMTAGGTPNTVGRIGTTALLTLTDTGLASLEPTAPDSVHVDVELVYP
jgi:hypothetical protein